MTCKVDNCEHAKLESDIGHAFKRWDEENQLVNQRLSWLGVTQAFLFTGFAILTVFQFEIGEGVALFGAATSSAILLGIAGALIAQKLIQSGLAKSLQNARADLQKKGKLGVHPLTTALGWVPAIALPVIFVAGWVCLYLFLKGNRIYDLDTKPIIELSIGSFEMRLNR